jgi:hypothetical protein
MHGADREQRHRIRAAIIMQWDRCMRQIAKTAAMAVVFLTAAAAQAAGTPADKCEASKNKTAGAYYSCRTKAEATAISKATSPDYSKCTAKFDDKWNGAEDGGTPMCPDNVSTADMNAYITQQAAAATAIIAGSANVPECGDGAINAVGEHCDGTALDGYSCSSLGFDAGSLACDIGCDFDTSGCTTDPTSCTFPCDGFEYAGGCWFLADNGASCTDTCTNEGRTYSMLTKTVAGSSGTNLACENVLDGLGAAGTGLDNPGFDCGSGLGCVVETNSERTRCALGETTAGAQSLNVLRACACQ